MIRDNDMINIFDVERVLGDLPIDIIKENLKTQIEDPLVFVTNHCDQVYETFEEAIVVTDVGQHQMFTTQYLEITPKKKLLTSGGLGTMGYGFPGATSLAPSYSSVVSHVIGSAILPQCPATP